MAHEIAVVMPTYDRSGRSPNFLEATLANMDRGGVWMSPHLHSFHIVDSGGGRDWPDRALINRVYSGNGIETPPNVIRVHRTEVRRAATINVAHALKIGAQSGAPYVLFCEDDIDVIGDFIGSVYRWLMDHSKTYAATYRFTADHDGLKDPKVRANGVMQYHMYDTWGTQCYALAAPVAYDLAQWYFDHPQYEHADGKKTEAYDLEMHNWGAARNIQWAFASSPSFCQHLAWQKGESSIWGDRERKVWFETFPGHDYVYERRK